jgi:hypothetical protein
MITRKSGADPLLTFSNAAGRRPTIAHGIADPTTTVGSGNELANPADHEH